MGIQTKIKDSGGSDLKFRGGRMGTLGVCLEFEQKNVPFLFLALTAFLTTSCPLKTHAHTAE